MGDVLLIAPIGGLSLPQEGRYDGVKESVKSSPVIRIFENAAKPVVLPITSSRRSEVAVEKTEESIYRVEAVIETGLDADEEFAETPDSEDQEEKEELSESSPDNKPAMEAGDFSEEEEEKNSEELHQEKLRSKESKALQKARSILLKNH